MKYFRLLSRLAGACMFISEDKLRVITEQVTMPLVLGEVDAVQRLPADSLASHRSRGEASTQRVARIEVFDSLVSKSASAASGMTSYQSISAQIDHAVASGATAIVFDVDSPGGEASGLFALTDKIRKLSTQGVQTIGYTDGMATSAAYAIFAACQQTYATETAVLGSIAAIMVHVDASEKDKAAGITYTILRSKPEKALGDSHSPLDTKARGKFETLLDTMDTAFNNDISLSRGVSVESIIALKGSELMAKAALDLGLVDEIVSGFDETLSLSFSKNLEGGRMTLEEAEAKIVALEADKVALQASLTELSAQLEQSGAAASGVATALNAQKAEFATLLTTAKTLRMDAAVAAEILAESDSISAAITTLKQVAKFAAPIISGSADLQSTLEMSTEDRESEHKKAEALAAYKKAKGE